LTVFKKKDANVVVTQTILVKKFKNVKEKIERKKKKRKRGVKVWGKNIFLKFFLENKSLKQKRKNLTSNKKTSLCNNGEAVTEKRQFYLRRGQANQQGVSGKAGMDTVAISGY